METVRACGCKGIRSCLLCEEEYRILKPRLKSELEKHRSYVYCPECERCWPGWDMDLYKTHPNHEGDSIEFPGVYIKLQFLSDEETSSLLKSLDDLPWEASQSGRRKQNFGPKCNFRKKKLRLGDFRGFPRSTHFVQEKFASVRLLEDFRTIEQCSLEYDPSRGSSIDPHVDDCWIWGERIVTVNVTGDTVLTMTRLRKPTTKYNLKDVGLYQPGIYEGLFECDRKEKRVDGEEEESNEEEDRLKKERLGELEEEEEIVVRLPMPEGSLMVLYGAARYAWEHSVLREDVETRRVCLAYREFTKPYLNGSTDVEVVHEILERAANFY